MNMIQSNAKPQLSKEKTDLYAVYEILAMVLLKLKSRLQKYS